MEFQPAKVHKNHDLLKYMLPYKTGLYYYSFTKYE